MDRYLLSGALTLLIFQVLFLLADIGLIAMPWLTKSDTVVSRPSIGRIVYTKQNVRRRMENSIMWESSTAQDQLYSYDSVLTLSKSSAQLELEGDVNIQLHENTLVVLEPMGDAAEDDFRLLFSHGNFRTKANNRNLKVGTDSWTIEASQGSDLSLRTLSGGEIEMEVAEGQVELQTKDGDTPKKVFEKGQRLTIDEEEIKDVKTISENLQWSYDKAQRLYSHNFPVAQSLRWEGEAKSIRWLKPGNKEEVVSVDALKPLTTEEETKNKKYYVTSLNFEPGTHYFTLVNEEHVSETLTFHVWPAPKIRYFSPLPRDRVKTGSPTTFSWSPIGEGFGYEVEVLSRGSDDPDDIAKSAINIVDLMVTERGQKFWHVYGVDEEGFKVPPFYKNELYSEPNPLAAPKLINPLKRIPASPPKKGKKINDQGNSDQIKGPRAVISGSDVIKENHQAKNIKVQNLNSNESIYFKKIMWSLNDIASRFYNLLFPKVYAEETRKKAPPVRQLIFSWYPVPEADQYIIEISSTPDFHKPEVIKTVKKEEFAWVGFKKKVYYWRVAAGQRNGRMGLFSEAAEINLSKLSDLSLGELTPGVKYVEAKKKSEKVKEKPKPKKKVAEKPKEPRIPKKLMLWAAASYNYTSFSGSDGLSGSLSGFVPVYLGGQAAISFKEKAHILLDLEYTSVEWVPESENDLVIQEDLPDARYDIMALYKGLYSDLSYGFSIKQVAGVRKRAYEEIKLREFLSYGGAAQLYVDHSKYLKGYHQVLINYGDEHYLLGSKNRFIYNVEEFGETQVFVGGQFHLDLLFGPDSHQSTSVNLGFLIGAQF